MCDSIISIIGQTLHCFQVPEYDLKSDQIGNLWGERDDTKVRIRNGIGAEKTVGATYPLL